MMLSALHTIFVFNLGQSYTNSHQSFQDELVAGT